MVWDDKESFKEEFLSRNKSLPFGHKLFLTAKSRENSDIAFVRIDKDNPLVIRRADFGKGFDIIQWLNLRETIGNKGDAKKGKSWS